MILGDTGDSNTNKTLQAQMIYRSIHSSLFTGRMGIELDDDDNSSFSSNDSGAYEDAVQITTEEIVPGF